MAWATATTERRRGRERVRVAILALTCLAQRRALNSWEAAHKADMRRRAALRIVDPRLRRMGAGFTRWFERAVQLGPGEEVAERDDAVAARRRHRALLGANRLPQ